MPMQVTPTPQLLMPSIHQKSSSVVESLGVRVDTRANVYVVHKKTSSILVSTVAVEHALACPLDVTRKPGVGPSSGLLPSCYR